MIGITITASVSPNISAKSPFGVPSRNAAEDDTFMSAPPSAFDGFINAEANCGRNTSNAPKSINGSRTISVSTSPRMSSITEIESGTSRVFMSLTLAYNNSANRIIVLIIHISIKRGTVKDCPAKFNQPL